MQDTVIIEANPAGQPAAYLVRAIEPGLDVTGAVAAAAREFSGTPKGIGLMTELNGTLPIGDFDLHVPEHVCVRHGFRLMPVDLLSVPFGWNTLAGRPEPMDVFLFLTEAETAALQAICGENADTAVTGGLRVAAETELGAMEFAIAPSGASPTGVSVEATLIDADKNAIETVTTDACSLSGCTLSLRGRDMRVYFRRDTLEARLAAAGIPFEKRGGMFHVLCNRTAHVLIAQFMKDNDLPVPDEIGRCPTAGEIPVGEYVFPETACKAR